MLTDRFYEGSDLTPQSAVRLVEDALRGADYGELYQEIIETEQIAKDKGRYTTVASGSTLSGFGLRFGQGERVGYAHSSIFNRQSLNDARASVRQVMQGAAGTVALEGAQRVPQQLYPVISPMSGMDLAEKIRKIDEIEAYIMSLDPRITNVTVGYAAVSKAVHIITKDGQDLVDLRPRTKLSLDIQVTNGEGKSETGHALLGGPVHCSEVFNLSVYQGAARKALRQAEELLIAADAPAGIMDVVLNQGWPAVILHEAVGHGLEADFNRKSISVYSGKIGQQIAATGVTVIDQGDIPGLRGSLHFDDEGTATRQNVLIENGVLRGYMQDRQNALLMQAPLTGNGRRESYEDLPMPRMTNTYFQTGSYDPAEIIGSVQDGLYIADMGGGQVDITSGKFNMNAHLAYRIRDGALCEPVKGASLVGDGLSVIKTITMVGNDLYHERASGMCGKDGQTVPVGCGQPTLRVSNMTIGGSGKR